MDRQALLRKLEAMFVEIERGRGWASVEVEFREGVANMIRTTKNEKVITQESTRDKYYR